MDIEAYASELLQYQGYALRRNNENMLIGTKPGGVELHVVFVPALNLETVKSVKSATPLHSTLFVCEKATPSAKKHDAPNITILTHTSLKQAIWAKNHRLAPVATVLHAEDVQEKGLHLPSLARLHRHDPMTVYLGAALNDVVEIRRPLYEGRSIVQYRVVV